MLDADQGAKAALRALRMFLPDEKFALSSLKDPTKLYDTWVFRCKLRGKNQSYICKLSTPDTSGRAKILNQYERLKAIKASLDNTQLTTPEALVFFEKECALIMQDVKGASLDQLLSEFATPSDASAHLKNAGHWLSAFQAPTLKAASFDPKPHMNWVAKKIQRHAENSLVIPDYDAFIVEFCKLEQLADACQGLPSFRCITHRDFHLGNLIFGRKGVIYGIDFENKKEDEALRDVMSFLFDFIIRWRGNVPTFADFQQAAEVLWQAYADPTTSPAVFEFFQKFTALNAWSGMDARQLVGHKKRGRLRVLAMLAKTSLLDTSLELAGQPRPALYK